MGAFFSFFSFFFVIFRFIGWGHRLPDADRCGAPPFVGSDATHEEEEEEEEGKGKRLVKEESFL